MSIEVMSRVWKYGPDDKGELLVMLALADFANDQGECWPSIGRVAEKARMSERGVQKIVARLVEEGLLVVHPNAGKKGTNLYVVMPPEGVNGVRGEPGSPRTPGPKGVNGVRPGGEPGSPEPSKNHQEPSRARARPSPPGEGASGAERDAYLAAVINGAEPHPITGKPYVPQSLIGPHLVRHLVEAGLVTAERMREVGLQ